MFEGLVVPKHDFCNFTLKGIVVGVGQGDYDSGDVIKVNVFGDGECDNIAGRARGFAVSSHLFCWIKKVEQCES